MLASDSTAKRWGTQKMKLSSKHRLEKDVASTFTLHSQGTMDTDSSRRPTDADRLVVSSVDSSNCYYSLLYMYLAVVPLFLRRIYHTLPCRNVQVLGTTNTGESGR